MRTKQINSRANFALLAALSAVIAFASLAGYANGLDQNSFIVQNSAQSAPPRGDAPSVNRINHVIWVWFENKENTTLTQANAPTFINLASTYANLTNFFGVSHPSQPNYLAAFSGSTQGITDDGHYSLPATVDNLAKQLSAAGKSWRTYQQNYTGTCNQADTISGGVDGAGVGGTYARKHNPAMTFQSVTGTPSECANVQPLANFDPLVNFSMVVPNLTNDMHDGTIQQGDAFLQQFLPQVINTPWFAETLLIITFDEGTSNTSGGGHIYTAAVAPWLHNVTISATYNHYNVLRTTEDIFGLPRLGAAATAAPISEIIPPPLAGTADFDGDGKSDVSVFRPSDGNWYLNRSTAGFGAIHFGVSGDVVVAGDYDGDGKTDEAVYRNGTWYVQRSTNGFAAFNFGTAGDIPVPGDYDGDGKADYAVFRPSNGVWYLQRSTAGFSAFNWGINGDIPVVADFNGDGKIDYTVYRSGKWYIYFTTNPGSTGYDLGVTGDIPVAGDYNGDGLADFAVYHPPTGVWSITYTSGGSQQVSFGLPSDIPVPGDYDGDGKTDIAVFRPSNGTWYMQRSTAGFGAQAFGTNGDVPVPSAFGQ
jgi:Phosphoesterase family/FG-GAP-like repeat/FG-GAP repeat